MIKEVIITEPITSEEEPDGSIIPVIDPYFGCSIGCPYCFRTSEEGWKNNIIVNTNIAELLDERLKSWPKEEAIYLGSMCDPYISIEKEYGLTRKCLEVLNKYQIPTFITTKSDNDLIIRDVDLLKNFCAKLIVLIGISNIRQLKNEYHGGKNHNIETANKLNRRGITVWSFITPILPYIVPVEQMINQFDEDIPVWLDLLRIKKDSIQAKQIKKFIAGEYPQLIEKYNKIIDDGNLEYYYELKDKYKDNKRIKFLPYKEDS